MRIQTELSDGAVLDELGGRMARCRLDLQLTQAELAEQAGVSKRTVERIEAGATTQVSTLIRILRVLNLLDGLDQLVPEAGPRPMDILKLKKKAGRKRASSRRKKAPGGEWHWGDEA
jgi:transcriptional regulator with XRE-family HTH domain